MNTYLLRLAVLSAVLLPCLPAIAEPNWVEVTTNAVGDRFSVDRNSIETRENSVWYWEYRSFEQPNNAFVEAEISEPVYGVMLYQSVDCVANVARLRQLIVYGDDQTQLQQFNYGDMGSLAQPVSGSSALRALRFACDQQAAPEAPETPETPAPNG